jgi:hypothetical protein
MDGADVTGANVGGAIGAKTGARVTGARVVGVERVGEAVVGAIVVVVVAGVLHGVHCLMYLFVSVARGRGVVRCGCGEWWRRWW